MQWPSLVPSDTERQLHPHIPWCQMQRWWFQFQNIQAFRKSYWQIIVEGGEKRDKKGSTWHPGHCAGSGYGHLAQEETTQECGQRSSVTCFMVLDEKYKGKYRTRAGWSWKTGQKKRRQTHVKKESEDGGEQKKEDIALDFKIKKKLCWDLCDDVVAFHV